MRTVLPDPLGPKPQQSQQLGEINEALDFGSFRSREGFPPVLTAQQLLQAAVHPLRQSESVELGWHFELDENVLGHWSFLLSFLGIVEVSFMAPGSFV